MIAHKCPKGRDVGGLLRYLFGPGTDQEHDNPRVVAGFDDLEVLEPPLSPAGGRDVRRLTTLLEAPVAALGRPPELSVYHVAVALSVDDERALTDAEFADAATEIMDAIGLARRGDDGGVRWVAVRHDDHHIHLVATLARQDGRRASEWGDYKAMREACRRLEVRLGLARRTASMDHTGHVRPSRGELGKAERLGEAVRISRRDPARDQLRRAVRAAAAAAVDERDFFSRVEDAGVMVRLRYSDVDPDVVTGYAVAWPGVRSVRDGQPVYFGGGRLAADLTLPKLRQRWERADPDVVTGLVGRLGREDRRVILDEAIRVVAASAEEIRQHAVMDPGGAAGAAYAASDVLAAAARVVEGERGGPLTRAAEAYDQAARELGGQVPAAPGDRWGLRAAAVMVSRIGRASGRDDFQRMGRLLRVFATLAEAVAQARDAQGRRAQAAAARQAAEALLASSAVTAAAGPARPVVPTQPQRLTPPQQRPGRHQ